MSEYTNGDAIKLGDMFLFPIIKDGETIFMCNNWDSMMSAINELTTQAAEIATLRQRVAELEGALEEIAGEYDDLSDSWDELFKSYQGVFHQAVEAGIIQPEGRTCEMCGYINDTVRPVLDESIGATGETYELCTDCVPEGAYATVIASTVLSVDFTPDTNNTD